MSLSERIRPNSEAAPWVIEEVKKLENYLEVMKINWKHQRDRADKAEDKIAVMEPELEVMTNLAKSIPSFGSAHDRMEKAEKKLRALYAVWGTTDPIKSQRLKEEFYGHCARADAELATERAMLDWLLQDNVIRFEESYSTRADIKAAMEREGSVK